MWAFGDEPTGSRHPVVEGDHARALHAERTDNPYAEGTDEFTAWDYGWQMVDMPRYLDD